MQQFDASKFVGISNYLAQLHQMMDRNRWVGFLLSDYDSLIRDVTIIRDQLRDMGLDAAEISAGKLLDVLSKPEAKDTNIVRFTVWDSNQIKAFGEEITARARDQLQARLFLFIPNDVKELYVQSAPLFGQSVSDKFQSLEYEIAEIGKCLALGRSTASAFHSIRCLEAGIKALSRCLGIPDPTKGSDRNWGKMLGAIKGEIDRRWPTTAHRMSGDGQFFENNYAALAAMRNP